jgi:hypothetical protein
MLRNPLFFAAFAFSLTISAASAAAAAAQDCNQANDRDLYAELFAVH